MDDVTQALEKAAECACGFLYSRGPCDCSDGMCGDDRANAIARAAVLAFLKEMPDWESVTGPATDPVETPKYYRLSLLVHDIEKERADGTR